MIRKSGVYSIHCIENNKIYIGSSKNIRERMLSHIASLKRGDHGNKYLQSSFDKYGLEKFRFNIVELTKDLWPREEYWIDFYNSYNNEFGFNLSDKPRTPSPILEKEWIIVFPDGSEKIIKNLQKFCIENNLDGSSMSKVAYGKVNHHKKYKCRLPDMSIEEWEKTRTRKDKNGIGWQGRWIVTFPDGKEIIIDKLTKFCKDNDLSEGAMAAIARGTGNSHKEFLCRKEGEPKPVCKKPPAEYILTDENGNESLVKNLVTFCKRNNLSIADLYAICDKNQTYGSYRCKRVKK